jgi:hypothetical protein
MRIALTMLLLALSASAYSQMYKWVDKDGKVQYTDTPPPADAKQQTPVSKPSPARPPSGEAKGKPEATPSGAKQEAATGGKFHPEEEIALGVLCGIAVLQGIECQLGLQRWCTLEELATGGASGNPKGFLKDPRLNPNYEYRVDIRGQDIAFSATPRKPGLAGFFNDGEGTRYNPNGRATKNDKRVQGGVNCAGFTK